MSRATVYHAGKRIYEGGFTIEPNHGLIQRTPWFTHIDVHLIRIEVQRDGETIVLENPKRTAPGIFDFAADGARATATRGIKPDGNYALTIRLLKKRKNADPETPSLFGSA